MSDDPYKSPEAENQMPPNTGRRPWKRWPYVILGLAVLLLIAGMAIVSGLNQAAESERKVIQDEVDSITVEMIKDLAKQVHESKTAPSSE